MYCTYWGQRISGAIVIADAERCFKRLDALRGTVVIRWQRTVPPTSPRRSVARARMPHPTPAAPN